MRKKAIGREREDEKKVGRGRRRNNHQLKEANNKMESNRSD